MLPDRGGVYVPSGPGHSQRTPRQRSSSSYAPNRVPHFELDALSGSPSPSSPTMYRSRPTDRITYASCGSFSAEMPCLRADSVIPRKSLLPAPSGSADSATTGKVTPVAAFMWLTSSRAA